MRRRGGWFGSGDPGWAFAPRCALVARSRRIPRDRWHTILEEVARFAEVSRSTTSRVLNDHPSVRPEVRARVRRVMDEVGYVPDSVARSLRRDRSGIVGLLIPPPAATVFSDAHFAALVAAVVRAARERTWTVAMLMVDDPLEPRPGGAVAGPTRMVERIAGGGLLDDVAVTAVDLLTALLDGRGAGDRRVLDVELVVRTSAPAAPG